MNLSGTWTQLLWRSTMFQSFSWINSWYEKRWNFCRVFLRMWWMPQAFLARRVLVEGWRRTWDVILQGVFLAWSFIQNKDTLYAVRRHASSLITPWLRCSLHYVLALSIFGRRFGSYGQLTRTGPAASAVEWRQFGWHFSESWGAMFPRETSWCFAVGTLYPRLAGWLRCSWDSGGVLYRGQWRAGRDAVVTILHPKKAFWFDSHPFIYSPLARHFGIFQTGAGVGLCWKLKQKDLHGTSHLGLSISSKFGWICFHVVQRAVHVDFLPLRLAGWTPCTVPSRSFPGRWHLKK